MLVVTVLVVANIMRVQLKSFGTPYFVQVKYVLQILNFIAQILLGLSYYFLDGCIADDRRLLLFLYILRFIYL